MKLHIFHSYVPLIFSLFFFFFSLLIFFKTLIHVLFLHFIANFFTGINSAVYILIYIYYLSQVPKFNAISKFRDHFTIIYVQTEWSTYPVSPALHCAFLTLWKLDYIQRYKLLSMCLCERNSEKIHGDEKSQRSKWEK